MKTMEINGHLREDLGSKAAKGLRREGQVPCVIYGGEQNIHFSADSRELDKILFTKDVFRVRVRLGDKTVDALVRDTQFHPVKDNLIHMDLAQVIEGKPVITYLPVILHGTPIGVKNGGVLRRNAKKLLVRGMVDDIPEALEINIEKMRIGHSLKVSDLSFAGLELLEADNRVVVAVKTSRKAVADDEEEEGEEGEEGGETAEGEAAEGGEENKE